MDIEQLMPHIERITKYLPKNDNGHCLNQLVYYFTFCFPEGYCYEKRNQALRVCRDYWNLFGCNLQWMTHSRTYKWMKVPRNYDLSTWSASYPQNNWCWQMAFHSGSEKFAAPNYCIDGVGNSTQTHNMSYLTLCIPITRLTEHPEYHPLQQYLNWANIMQAQYGTSGIGIMPAYDLTIRSQTSGIIHALSCDYPGLEVCDGIQWMGNGGDLLSPNWLNLLDEHYVDKLGGYGHVINYLSGSNARVHQYDGGIIISASESPQLCELNEFTVAPNDYRVVSRLMSPFRSQHLFGYWGQRSDEILAWRNRMD